MAQAQAMIGQCYYHGEGVEKDYAKAFVWYEKAAEQGMVQVQTAMGQCYYLGHGVQKDYTKAAQCWKKAADQGDPDSIANMAILYANGLGVKKNLEQAMSLAQRAKAAGAENADAVLTDVQKATDAAKPAPAPELTNEERYRQGMALFREGKYDEAFPLLDRACPIIGMRKNKYPDGQAALA